MSKHPLAEFVKQYGFVVYEDAALERLDTVVHVVVGNTLKNLASVMQACNCKVADAKHFKLLLTVNKQLLARKSAAAQSGGAVVLPSEYFGIDSGRYFNDVSANETVMSGSSVPEGLARPELNVLHAGGKMALLSPRYIAKHIRHHAPAFKMNAKAKTELMAVVVANLADVLKAVRGKTLTLAAVKKVLSYKKFKHL